MARCKKKMKKQFPVFYTSIRRDLPMLRTAQEKRRPSIGFYETSTLTTGGNNNIIIAMVLLLV